MVYYTLQKISCYTVCLKSVITLIMSVILPVMMVANATSDSVIIMSEW